MSSNAGGCTRDVLRRSQPKGSDGTGVQQTSALLTIVRALQRRVICSLSKAWAASHGLGFRLSTVNTLLSTHINVSRSMRLSTKLADGEAEICRLRLVGNVSAMIAGSDPWKPRFVQCTVA